MRSFLLLLCPFTYNFFILSYLPGSLERKPMSSEIYLKKKKERQKYTLRKYILQENCSWRIESSKNLIFLAQIGSMQINCSSEYNNQTTTTECLPGK